MSLIAMTFSQNPLCIDQVVEGIRNLLNRHLCVCVCIRPNLCNESSHGSAKGDHLRTNHAQLLRRPWCVVAGPALAARKQFFYENLFVLRCGRTSLVLRHGAPSRNKRGGHMDRAPIPHQFARCRLWSRMLPVCSPRRFMIISLRSSAPSSMPPLSSASSPSSSSPSSSSSSSSLLSPSLSASSLDSPS